MEFHKHIDTPTLIVGILTLVLFIAALYTKEVLHDALLEIAVFLISFKLIIGVYKNSITSSRIEARLEKIQKTLDGIVDSDREED